MRYFLTAALGLALTVVSVQAQEALPFTRIDRNPVTSAFAGAGSASAGTAAYTAFSNASVLPFFDGTLDAAVSYQNWAPSLSKAMHVNAGVAYKVTPNLGVSVGYAMQRGAAMEMVNGEGVQDGSFRPSDQLVALGLAYRLGEKWALGVNGRYAMQTLAESAKYSGFSGDAFIAFEPMANLRLTAGVSTLGSKVASQSGDTFGQPASAKAAADWGLRFGDAFGLDLMADGDYYFSGNYGLSVGTELSWNRMVFLRGGYRYASEGCVIPGHVGVGAGVRFAGFRVDVSWLTASPVLGNTLSAGLGFTF